MRNPALYLIALLFLSACATTPPSLYNKELKGITATSNLYQITISSFGKQRFSGLLAVTQKTAELNYFLLDSTGIKLLEVYVTGEGRFRVQTGIQKLKESSLPSILSKSLYRIFLLEPKDTPCTTTLFRSLCQEKEGEKSLIKYSDLGPFTQWKIEYIEIDNNLIIYTGPWYGPDIELRQL